MSPVTPRYLVDRVPTVEVKGVAWTELVERSVKIFSPDEASRRIVRMVSDTLSLKTIHCDTFFESLTEDIRFPFGSASNVLVKVSNCQDRGGWGRGEAGSGGVGVAFPSQGGREGKPDMEWREKIIERIQYCLDQASRMIECYLLAAESLGLPTKGSFNKTFLCYAVYSFEGRLEKVLKYKTARLLSLALEQKELPESVPLHRWDRVNYLLGGQLGRRIYRTCEARAGRRPAVVLAYTFYQSKRGSLPVDQRFIQNALLKHHKLICDPRPDETGEEEKILHSHAQQVRRTVREAYSGFRRGPVRGKIPSFGSCVENSRSQAGAFGQLVNKGTHPRPILGPAEGYLSHFVCWRDQIAEYRVPGWWWQEDVEPDLWQNPHDGGPIDCIPVPLCEPFKVRVITRGQAKAYHIAREHQSPFHRGLSRRAPFRLTQGPLNQYHLEDLLSKIPVATDNHGVWVSGDYSSATDNIHPYLSEVCMEEMCKVLRVSWHHRMMLLKALTGHHVEWVGTDDGRADAAQEWGQMMGSPVSFPVLCIINAAITRRYMENMQKRVIPLIHCPMLINGDDILFWLSDESQYEGWKDYVAVAGLEPSVGKNYVSDRFVVINSEIWELKKFRDFFGSTRWTSVDRLKVLNLGLLRAEVKSKSSFAAEKTLFGSHHMQRDSLRQKAFDLLEGLQEEYHDRFMTLFIRGHREHLESLPEGMSWWVHPSYGGVGLPVTREVDITFEQRRIATFFHLGGLAALRHKVSVSAAIPAFLKASLCTAHQCLDALGSPVRVGEEVDSFGFFSHALCSFLEHSCDPTDPQGLSELRESWESLKKRSRKSWGNPLSFRKCTQGPTEFWGYPGLKRA